MELAFHHRARSPDPEKLFNAGPGGSQWRSTWSSSIGVRPGGAGRGETRVAFDDVKMAAPGG
jgi:hypothetical protein